MIAYKQKIKHAAFYEDIQLVIKDLEEQPEQKLGNKSRRKIYRAKQEFNGTEVGLMFIISMSNIKQFDIQTILIVV